MDICIFDTHCDTLTTLKKDESLFDADRNFNFRQTERYKRYIQVTALWTDCGREDPVAKTNRYLDKFYAELALNPHVSLILSASDIEKASNGTYVLLAIEGGEAVGRDINGVSSLHERGVRLITLTWNTPYAISDTNASGAVNLNGEDDYSGGLTHFGRDVVREMNRLGMMIDVSHISDKGFYDVAETSDAPFIASHSNSRSLCGHPRNLTDDMFRILIDKGGVTGINFCPGFLKEGGGAGIDDIIRHIEHFMSLGGTDNVGLGSDFDGIDTLPRGITGAADMYKIADELLRLNYSESLVEAVMHGNMERVFKKVLE